MAETKDTGISQGSGSVTASVSAGSTLVSSGLEDNIIIEHTGGGGEVETIYIEAPPEGATYTMIGDGQGGNVTHAGITYEISITGGDGDDVFIAQSGNVIASGEGGSDTYVWQGGNLLIDQQGVTETVETIIIENDSVTLSDFLFFPANLGLGESGFNDLRVLVLTSGEQIIFTDQFMNFTGQTEVDKLVKLQINDGPVIELTNFDEWVYTYDSNDVLTGQTVFSDGGNDHVTGTSGDDILSGGMGNDTLIGLAGNDYLDGGMGDDLLIHQYEGANGADYYVGASGTDILEFHISQADFDTAEIRNDLYALQQNIAAAADPDGVNGEGFTGATLGLTAVDFERVDVYVDGILTEVVPIHINLAPELEGTGQVAHEMSEITIEFTLDPRPQDFPELTEGQRLSPDELINGTNRANLIFDNDHQVNVNFMNESASYKNTIGYYTVEIDGTISNVTILAENASGNGSGLNGGGSFAHGDLIADLGMVSAGTEIGFFIIADGYNHNGQYQNINFDGASLDFRNNDGMAANIHDENATLVVTDANGNEIIINGDIYHASSSALNGDGIEHSVSGINENGNLQISFEDLRYGGDADFDDMTIELQVADATDTALDTFTIASDFTISDDGMLSQMIIMIADGAANGDILSLDGDIVMNSGLAFEALENGTMILSGEASAETYQEVLRSLSFGNAFDDPAAGTRSVSVEIIDTEGLSGSAVINVDVLLPGGLDSQDVLADNDTLFFGGGDGVADAGLTPDYDGGLHVDDLIVTVPGDFG